MKVLLDTNVILDVVAHREPHYEKSASILELCRLGALDGVICSLSYATIAYILSKVLSRDDLYRCLDKLTSLCGISIVDDSTIVAAIGAHRKDFEDSIQYFSAKSSDIDCIISRDKTGFLDFPITVLTPEEFLEQCIYSK